MKPEAVRTFIHIGYPKCASTYLQKEVFPSMGNFADLTKQPHSVKWMFLDDEDPEIIRGHMDAATEHHRSEKSYRIISYEGLVPKLFRTFADLYWDTRRMDVSRYRNPKQSVVEKMAEVFPDASFIIVIREQIAWAISQHKMYWRRGHVLNGIDEFINRYEDGYDKIIEQYQKAFGVDKVRVIPYELLRVDPAAFVHSVAHFIDPEFEPKISDKRVNYAPDLLKDVSYERNRRVLKQELKRKSGNSGIKRLWVRLLSLAIDLFGRPYYAMKYGNQKHQVRVSEEVLKAIRPELAKSNRRVQELTGLDLRQFGYCLDDDSDSESAH